MQPGSFYAFVPKPGSWLQSLGSLGRSGSAKLVHAKLDSVLSSWEDDAPLCSSSFSYDAATPPTPLPSPAGSSLSRQGSLPQTQCYVSKHAGLTVKVGLQEVASDLFRVKPYVYSLPDASAVIVFSGCLRNLSELACRRASASPGGGRGRGGSPGRDPNNGAPAQPPLERRSSIERSLDVGSLTASTVLGMYLDVAADGNELIMLSELQGEYAIVIYDNKHKQAFAARDPSGQEDLFYHVGEDGSISFASSRLAIPDGEQPQHWRELPPGHFVSGRPPKLHQFALTPQQLVMREIEEEDELGASLGGGRRRSLAGLDPDDELALATSLHTRTSLDNDRLVKLRAGLDSDVFALEL